METKPIYRLMAAFKVGLIAGFHEMRTHKLRSFLSLFGVMLGVGALVAMLTIVGGVDDFMQREMGDFAGRVGISHAHRPEDLAEAIEWSRSPGFRFSDLDFLEKLDEVSKVYRAINERTHSRVGRKWHRIRAMGTGPENLESETNVKIAEGRFFTAEEYEKGLPVCVISWQLRDYINEEERTEKPESVVGKTMALFGKQFSIIGVFELKNKMMRTWHYRHMVYMPLLAMQRYGSGFNPDPGWSTIRVSDVKDVDNQIAIIGEKLAREHRSVEDFELHVFEFLKEFMTLLRNVNILFGAIAVSSLTVGGLGIMNVMLSSLSERIHEIGIRQALGASPYQVFVQFLTETIVLSLVGGTIGAVVGSLPMIFGEQIYQAVNELIRPQLQTYHMVAVFWVVVLVGVVFGMYPALKASRLNPVDALRYE